MSGHRWPEGGDPAAVALRAALYEAALRGPDDMTLRRGWTAVASPEPRRRARGWSWFAGGVATSAALAAVVAVWLWPRALETTSNTLARTRQGATFSAPASEPRRLKFEDGVEAQLGAASVIRLEGGGAKVETGDVRFSVPHRAPGHSFVVRADDYSVVVVGTRFGVSVSGRAVDVDVDAGVVEVWRTGTQLRLARLLPGEAWHGVPPSPATPTAAADASRAKVPAAKPPVRAGHPLLLRRSAAESSRRLALDAPKELPMSTSRATGGGSDPRSTTDDLAAVAQAALAGGDAPRALQIYRTIAQQGTGPVAENAAYEIGKVLSESLGQPSEAIAAWKRYRAAYPDGNLRVEADVSIIETLARSGDADGAISEANEFLRRRPESERRAEIARLAGDLHRARGDCRRAVAAYEIALGASRPPDIVEIASFHRASCLVSLGDPAGVDAARAYLRSYPAGRFRGEAAALIGEGARPGDGQAIRR